MATFRLLLSTEEMVTFEARCSLETLRRRLEEEGSLTVDGTLAGLHTAPRRIKGEFFRDLVAGIFLVEADRDAPAAAPDRHGATPKVQV